MRGFKKGIFFIRLKYMIKKFFRPRLLESVRTIKIQTRLIASFLLLSFLPLTVTSFISYNKSSDAIENKTEIYSVQVMNEFSRNLKTGLGYMESLFEELSMSEEIQTSLINYVNANKNEKFKIDDSISLKFIEKMRISIFNASSQITSIDVLVDKDTIIGVGQNNYDTKQFEEILNKCKDEGKGYNYGIVKDLNGNFEILIDKVIKNHSNGSEIGTLILTFKESYISDICKQLNMGDNSEIFLIDSKGKIISSGDETKIPINKEYSEKALIEKILKNNEQGKYDFPMVLNGEKRLVSYSGIENSGWFIVSTIPYKYLQAESKNLMINIILIGLMCLIVAIPVSFIISFSISNPVNKLKKVMNEAKNGKFDIELIDNNCDEIAEISKSFNEMILSIRFLVQENIDTQKEIVYKLGEVTEARSKETGNHIMRVAYYSKLMALKYGISEENAETFKVASTLHDIGKISMPDRILLKPGKLTEDEFQVMKTHTSVGHDILSNSNKELLKIASSIALEHHEKYDGTGYPRGLKGDEIGIYSRIVALTDVFDALGTERVYKKKWELDKIIDYFNEQRGKQFDPKIVDLFMENLDEIKIIYSKFKD